MSSSDAVSETIDDGSNGVAGRVESLAATVGPKLSRHAESGTLAAASGVVSLARAGRTFLRGDRKRGGLQALAGLFWVGVALAQRRFDADGDRRSDADVAEVADTSPDVADAVESDSGDGDDHATGESVVDTTDADLDESDTGTEVGTSTDVAGDADGDVDQRDVTDSTDVEAAVEDGENEAESDANDESDDDGEAESDASDDHPASDGSDDATESAESDD